MKYRLPDGCASVSCGGKELHADSDGTIELDPAAAAELMPHGIELIVAGPRPSGGRNGGDGASGGKPAASASGGRAPR